MDRATTLPRHVPEQIALYQGDLLITQPVFRFDPDGVVAALQRSRRVLAIDIGGDKLRSAVYDIGGGALTRGEVEVLRGAGGAGYLARLEELARKAEASDLPVGVSVAIKLTGSVVTRTVNLPVFFDELTRRYGGDFRRLFGERLVVANDTVMGICGAATRLSINGAPPERVAFIICASGMGGAVIADGLAMHVEVGHVPVVDALNPLGQATPCGVEGRQFTCVERVAAARAGIEDLYRQRTGEALDGVAIGERYAAGDPLATTLYRTSAAAVAHAIVGLTQRFGFPPSDRSVVVLHGGNFEMPHYREAVRAALAAIPHPRCRIVFSRDLSTNTCLDGAAAMAAYRPERA